MSLSLSPTPQQQAIIDAVASGQDLMVDALAGTGKTSTIELALRAASSIPTLVLAFNVKIKDELARRLKDLPHVKVQTANGLGHTVCNKSLGRPTLEKDKLLRLAKKTGLRGDDLFDLLRLARAARLAGCVPAGLAGTSQMEDADPAWRELCEVVDADPVLIAGARDILRQSHKECLASTIDYDDQIYLSACVLGGFPRYDRVVVDEAQDLSPLNHVQVRKALGPRGQLMAVGDPNQAIYAFRGASHDSMDQLWALRPDGVRLPLSISWRCPRTVVARQQPFVPMFQAAPEAPEGQVLAPSKWTPAAGTAILCRNNAPLYAMAFTLLRKGLPVQMLGTDIGRGLKRLYNTLSDHGSKSIDEVVDACERAAEADPKKADRMESLSAILRAHGENFEGALAAISTPKAGAITLATGHRAKGLEWPHVYHLDEWLIPSKWAESASELRQEDNLRYVIETRAKETLSLVHRQGLRL